MRQDNYLNHINKSTAEWVKKNKGAAMTQFRYRPQCDFNFVAQPQESGALMNAVYLN